MKLNFTISEFLKSETATKYGIDNIPHNNQVLDNILLLIVNVMQPLRNYVGKPIIITSGYRSIGLNAKVGGVPNSQHLNGQACDFVIQGMTINEAIKAVKNSGIIFDQCINEGSWVHISFNINKNRKSFI
jgi:uncharacterized protein YcbK (DUF882 family)